MQPGTLFIVATPIGNMQDITLRALETLKQVDLILCEDTRHTGQLLTHFSIVKPLKRFDDIVENRSTAEVIQLLKDGKSIALVSDAGTPLVSDPGFKLVRDVVAAGIAVESLPGATAAVTALTLSGLPSDKFFFVGFLPEKQGKRLKLLQSLKPLCHSERSEESSTPIAPPTMEDSTLIALNDTVKATIILYESPYKLQKHLVDMHAVFGDIPIVVCRELTKLHQEVFRGTISEASNHFKNPKGEFVLLI